MNLKKIVTRILTKASILSLLICLIFINSTTGQFVDIETSSGNTIEIGTLDLGLRSGQSNFVSGADSMEPGDSVARDIYVQNLGNNPFDYKASYEFVSGDQDLCSNLQLKVRYNWYDALPQPPNYHEHRHMDLKYSGKLVDFDDFDTNSPTHDPDMTLPNIHPYFSNIFYAQNEHWFYYQITLPAGSGYLLDKVCTFNIKVKGWQVGLDEADSGFWDEEAIQSTIGTQRRCEEGQEAIEVAPIDRVNIGESLSESLHDIDGWSSPNLPGDYGGRDDKTFRQIVEETSCDDNGREAKFVLYAGNRKAQLLRIRALDGKSNLDSFEVYVNDDLVGTYTDVQDSAEIWHDFEIPLDNLSGRLEVKLRAIDNIWSDCSTYGQVAVSWAEIDGYYCSPDEEIIPDSVDSVCQSPQTPVVVDPIDSLNIGETTSESTHNMLGWSTENLPDGYGGGDDGTYRQIISELHCSDEYRVAGFTLNIGSNIADLLRLRVLDGISNKDGFDVYVNDEFLAHLPDLTQGHPEQWQTYSIPLPNLTGEIKVRLVGFDEFWNLCSTYGQVAVSWAEIAGYTCGQEATTDHLVINEVYYDTLGTESEEEWLEIYNPTGSTVDLSGYKLGDEETKGQGEGMYQFPSGASIAADSFVVVAQNATAFHTRWGYYPDYEFSSNEAGVPDMIKYTSWSSGVVGLNNDGDEALLLNESDVAVDVVTWESGSYSGVTPHGGVTNGHSIARVQKGADTDDCSVDFYDNANPDPGTNPGDFNSSLSGYLDAARQRLGFLLNHISPYNRIDYQVNYLRDGDIEEMVTGYLDHDGSQSKKHEWIDLGTCSAGICTYHQNIHEIILRVVLKGDAIPDRTLEDQID